MPATYKLILFVVASLLLAWLSKESLRHRRSHGFYRFFAWEVIVILILLVIDRWFSNPFSPMQIVSWTLLIISLVLAIWGGLLLRQRGKPDSGRQDPSLIGIEKTTELVTTGVYRHIRHPLYSSLLFLTWGAFFKGPSLPGIVLTAAATVLLTLTARAEEAENIRYFGPAYQEYMKRTSRFIPFVL